MSKRFHSRIGLGSVAVLVLLSAGAAGAGLWKLLGISWIAFGAMAGGAALERRAAAPQRASRRPVWGYGVAAGAMMASAALFLVPKTLAYDAVLGSLGLALGVAVGFAMHAAAGRSRRQAPAVVVELSVHALAAGFVIGLASAAGPALSGLLGVAIVSHKGPAGYAAAQQLAQQGRSASAVLVPASAVGVAALPVGLLGVPLSAALGALVFGAATGVLLHVAFDFLPRQELALLRWEAVLGTAAGALLVVAAWAALYF